jgi:hypothetical protein
VIVCGSAGIILNLAHGIYNTVGFKIKNSPTFVPQSK